MEKVPQVDAVELRRDHMPKLDERLSLDNGAAATPLEALLAKSPRDRQVGGNHYAGPAVQYWDVVDTWPIEQQIGAHRGALLQYVMRLGRKEGVALLTDAEKIQHTAEKLVEVLRRAEK